MSASGLLRRVEFPNWKFSGLQEPRHLNAGDGDTWHDVIVRNPTNSSNAASGITFVMNNTYHKNAGAGIAAISGGSDYMASLAFITRPNGAVAVERMRIQYDGNVGIGSATPSSKFHIWDGSTVDAFKVENYNRGAVWNSVGAGGMYSEYQLTGDMEVSV